MADVALPTEIRLWMRARHWGDHHLEWHAMRQWDRMTPAARAAAVARGWRRYRIQEGEAGNGREFLVMHRAMIELLRAEFPASVALFTGWVAVPSDPDDPSDPVPPTAERVFDPNMLAAVTALQTVPATVGTNDDDFGLFLETSFRPLPGSPRNVSTDRRTGLHNYLHNRFSDSSSPINMGSPAVNIENEQFWKLHGWIDARWSAYRAARGLPPEDAALRAEIDAAKTHLSGAHDAGHLEALPSAPALDTLPRSLREPFAHTLAGDFEALVAEKPYPKTLDEVKEYLQVAIRLELATLPLYLTAKWSLKGGGQVGIFTAIGEEEMLHMGLACNLLVAFGGQPAFATAENVIRYPDVLPGIEATAPFALEAFSVDQVRRFMEIEMPAHGPIPDTLEAVPTFHTIGDFYIALEQGLTLLNPPTFATERQLTATFGNGHELTTIRNLDEAKAALQLIRKQGEGTPQSQGAGGDELAHYYQFNQIAQQRYYTQQADSTWKLDPSKPLPLPGADGVWPMARVPVGGYPDVPEAVAFDQIYSDMLRALQGAWMWPNGADSLDTAVTLMRSLRLKALVLMKKPRGPQYGSGNYGPAFRFVPPASGGGLEALEEPAATATVPSFGRIQRVLDDAVNGEEIGAHGPFWRGVTRDEFVALSVFGRPLLAKKADGSFDADESNLVKALEGRPPFGRNLIPRPPGATMNQMPSGGLPPVPAERIAEVRAWIVAGCPNVAPIVGWVADDPAPAVADDEHVRFWRDFDNTFLFRAPPQTRADVNTFFGSALAYHEFAAGRWPETAWQTALADADVQAAFGRLEALQREEFVSHYGRPVTVAVLLDAFAKFGADELPDDPQRPGNRHKMDGEVMWANWAAFADAALRYAPSNATIPADFWAAVGRGILLGFLSDGVIRGRFPVTGFANDAAGKVAMRTHAAGLSVATLPAELAARLKAGEIM